MRTQRAEANTFAVVHRDEMPVLALSVFEFESRLFLLSGIQSGEKSRCGILHIFGGIVQMTFVCEAARDG